MISAFGSLLIGSSDTARYDGAGWYRFDYFDFLSRPCRNIQAFDRGGETAYRWELWIAEKNEWFPLEGPEAPQLTKSGGIGGLPARSPKLEVGFARKSLGEERKAIKDYTARLARTRDPKLRKALTHARKEEREHASLFVTWLKGR